MPLNHGTFYSTCKLGQRTRDNRPQYSYQAKQKREESSQPNHHITPGIEGPSFRFPDLYNHSWHKFATNHVITMWQNKPHILAASKAQIPRMRLSHMHIVVLFLCNINYHELYKFLFYKISKLHLWYE